MNRVAPATSPKISTVGARSDRGSEQDENDAEKKREAHGPRRNRSTAIRSIRDAKRLLVRDRQLGERFAQARNQQLVAHHRTLERCEVDLAGLHHPDDIIAVLPAR